MQAKFLMSEAKKHRDVVLLQGTRMKKGESDCRVLSKTGLEMHVGWVTRLNIGGWQYTFTNI